MSCLSYFVLAFRVKLSYSTRFEQSFKAPHLIRNLVQTALNLSWDQKRDYVKARQALLARNEAIREKRRELVGKIEVRVLRSQYAFFFSKLATKIMANYKHIDVILHLWSLLTFTWHWAIWSSWNPCYFCKGIWSQKKPISSCRIQSLICIGIAIREKFQTLIYTISCLYFAEDSINLLIQLWVCDRSLLIKLYVACSKQFLEQHHWWVDRKQ